MDTPLGSPCQRIIEPIFARSVADPRRAALADAAGQLTYEELGHAIVSAAGVLEAHGVAPGDRVVVAAVNSVREVVAHLALLAIGATVVPLGKVPTERLAFVAADCGASVVCVDDSDVKTKEELPEDATVVRLTDLAVGGVSGAMRGAHDALSERLRPANSIASLMYTTGSTGQPKGVMISHGGLGAALAHIIEYVGFAEDDRELVVLPLSHSFGLGQLYCTLAVGGFVWINEGLRPLKTVLDAFRLHRITAFSTTPSMLRLLLGIYRKPFLDNARHLRRMVVNSEPLPADQAAEVMAALPDVDLVVYYGLTEASRSTFLRPRLEPSERHRTVGRSAPRVEVQVCDANGQPAKDGGEGEVCIRGPHLATGYWRRPAEQAAAFRSGWLHTGDLGVIDADGYLTITGRLKDQINVGGLKVSAAEVEKVIRQHPMVVDVAVTGMRDPDGLRGEAVAAAIVSRTGLELREISDFCAERLEAAARPQRMILIDQIPRAETGKVLKGELHRLFERQG
ncbi:MAG TPA: class I adenylate-forming enzyme family protein [Reyranella sp.]|nr:class I adenylate-forming enzyme family protein [Reyranella sp.]